MFKINYINSKTSDTNLVGVFSPTEMMNKHDDILQVFEKLGGAMYQNKVKKKIIFTAEIICSAFHTIKNIPHNNIVVLGRDAWPLFPMLHISRIPSQYFVFSRPQIGCRRTQQLWLKEVYPGSLVVDTGFNGTIISHISSFNFSTQGGVLFCSNNNNKYPSITNYHYNNVLHYIEHEGKLCRRKANTVTPHGNIVWGSIVSDDEQANKLKVKTQLLYNYALLRLCGLSVRNAQKFSSFTGSTPKERLMMSANQREVHYRKVSFARNKYNEQQSSKIMYNCINKDCGSVHCGHCHTRVSKDNSIPSDWKNFILYNWDGDALCKHKYGYGY